MNVRQRIAAVVNAMDRTARIEEAAMAILAAQGRIAHQRERIALLEADGSHVAAAYAQETLRIMTDQLIGLRTLRTIMIDAVGTLADTARILCKKK